MTWKEIPHIKIKFVEKNHVG